MASLSFFFKWSISVIFHMNHLRHICTTLFNLIFPPICLCCKESHADKWFCESCWQLLAFSDWTSRCRHCFEETERLLCDVCRKSPLLCFPHMRLFDASPAAFILQQNLEEIEEALAAMAFVFWDHLALAQPDIVIAVPDEKGSWIQFSDSSLFGLVVESTLRSRIKENLFRIFKSLILLFFLHFATQSGSPFTRRGKLDILAAKSIFKSCRFFSQKSFF